MAWRGPEVKVFDTWCQDGSSFTDQGWQFFSCSKYVPEGAGIGINYFGNALIPSQRQSGYGGVIGGKYLLLGIQTKVIVAVPRTALPLWDVPIWIRLALIEDLQPTGVDPVAPFGFQDSVDNPVKVLTFPSWGGSQVGRYRVLRDKVFQLKPAALTALSGTTNAYYTFYEGVYCEFDYWWEGGCEVLVKPNQTAGPSVSALTNRSVFLAGCRTTCQAYQAPETVRYYFSSRAYYSEI